MSEKTTTVTVSGLALQPNDLSGVPAGSHAVADNVYMRRPGTIEPADLQDAIVLEGFDEDPVRIPLKTFADGLNNEVSTIISFTDAVVDEPHIGTALQFQDLDTNDFEVVTQVRQDSTNATPRPLEFLPGLSHSTYSRDRRIFTMQGSPIVRTENVSGTGKETRLPGLMPPGGVIWTGADIGSGTVIVDINQHAFYKAVFYRHYQTYDLYSAPTARYLLENGGTQKLGGVAIAVDFDPKTTTVQEGDILILYRTPFVSNDVDPGDELQEAARYTLLSSDITAGGFTMNDNCPNENLGGFLYTNPSQEGPRAPNYPPPDSRFVATFNDTTFYALAREWPAMSFGINDFGSINAGAEVGRLVATSSNVIPPGGTQVRVTGDITASLAANMVVIFDGIPYGVVDTFTFIAGETRISIIAGLMGWGLPGVFTPGFAASSNFEISDSIAFTYHLYDGSSDERLFWVFQNDPYALPYDFNRGDIGYNVYGVNVNDLSVPEAPRVNLSLVTTQPGRFMSFDIHVSHGTGYTQMDQILTNGVGVKKSVQSTSKSRLYWSKTSLPEAVAPLNYIDVGHDQMLRAVTDNNSLYVACTDGVYRITGQGDDWTVTQVTRTSRLVHPDAMVALNGQVFGWFTDGVGAVTESDVTNLSNNAVGPDIDPLARDYVNTAFDHWGPSLAADDVEHELALFTARDLYTPVQTWVFNTNTSNWCTRSKLEGTCGAYPQKLGVLYYPGSVGDVSTGNAVLRFDSSLNGWEAPEIRPNIFTAGAAGNLKEWIDLNLLIARPITLGVETEDPPSTTIKVQFLFEEDAATAQAYNYRFATERSLQREHVWVPRRCKVQDTLAAGFCIIPEDEQGRAQNVYFQLQGYVLRYRIASETFQK